MAYRDERDALRARVDNLQQELEQAKAAADEIVLFPKKTPRQRMIQAGIAGGALVALAAAGAGAWLWSSRAADREVATAWGRFSTCMIGEPLAAGESVVARARRIQLANVSAPRGTAGLWPSRCQSESHRLYQALHDNGRAEPGTHDTAYWAEELATKLEHGHTNDELLAILDSLYKQAQRLAPAAVAVADETPPPTPASPLHLADLAAAAITSVETPVTSIYLDALPGPDRHALIDAVGTGAPTICSLTAVTGAFACRPLPGDVAKKRGLRLMGTADEGAAPLVFAGHDGADGIFRSDTGELVASVRAYSSYAARDGYVAVQAWPSDSDGSFDVFVQRHPHDEVTKTTVRPEAQRKIQPTTTIHRSRILWDKAILQMLNDKHLDTSPWVAYRTLPSEGAEGTFHRIADLNWINTTITGCRGAGGMVVRFGPEEAYLLFNEGDHWQGPLAAHGLGELRCDGADAVFLSDWPVHVQRCTPAGCDTETHSFGEWPTRPERGMSAFDVVDGKVVAAWATEHDGVRVRVASPTTIGDVADVVVYDDIVGEGGQVAKVSGVAGLRLVAAGHTAVLLVATGSGLRAIRIGADGTFAPATIAH